MTGYVIIFGIGYLVGYIVATTVEYLDQKAKNAIRN
jgi:hypothetical protein